MKRPSGKIPFAKKSFGQNFLIDQNIISKIVGSLELSVTDSVVEIGPGRGALTEKLIDKAGKVIAVELDRDMASILREQFAEKENFQLIEQDVLKIEFSELSETNRGPLKLVANLPYYISTAILQHLIAERAAFSRLVLMFQREVVDRIAAPPGTPDRGFLSVMVEAYMSVSRLFDVHPAAFRPVPNVWSTVAVFHPNKSLIKNPEAFRKIVSAGFAQRRKTILNNLKSIGPNAAFTIEQAAIDSSRRAESLTLEEWVRITDAFSAGRD